MCSHDVYNDLIDGNNTRIYRMLQCNKIKVNEPLPNDPRGNTLLHLAITFRNINLIKRLMDEGALMTIKNRKNETACDLLAYSGLGDMIQYYVSDCNPVMALKEKVRELNATVKYKDGVLNTLQQTKINLLNELEYSKTEYRQLEKKLNTSITDNGNLLEEKHNMICDIDTLKETNTKLTQELNQIRSRKRVREEDSAEMECVKRQRRAYEEENIKLKEENNQLKRSVANLINSTRQ